EVTKKRAFVRVVPRGRSARLQPSEASGVRPSTLRRFRAAMPFVLVLSCFRGSVRSGARGFSRANARNVRSVRVQPADARVDHEDTKSRRSVLLFVWSRVVGARGFSRANPATSVLSG